MGFVLFPHGAESPTRKYSGALKARNLGKRQSPIILIADRDKDFANSLLQELNGKGFKCFLANSANEAYSTSLEVLPDAVVICCNIAREGDGLQAAKQILSRRSLTAIVALTDLDSKIGEKAERIGIEVFIQRSLGIEKVVNTICGICEVRKLSFRMIAK